MTVKLTYGVRDALSSCAGWIGAVAKDACSCSAGAYGIVSSTGSIGADELEACCMGAHDNNSCEGVPLDLRSIAKDRWI